jgi:hypothetical protein
MRHDSICIYEVLQNCGFSYIDITEYQILTLRCQLLDLTYEECLTSFDSEQALKGHFEYSPEGKAPVG